MFGTDNLEIMITQREGREPNTFKKSENQLTVELVEEFINDVMFRPTQEKLVYIDIDKENLLYKKAFEECWNKSIKD